MPVLSHASVVKLVTCDPRLKKVVWAVSDVMPLVVVCGFRGKEEQEKAFNEGKSKLHYPESKHNFTPSRAVDLAPLVAGVIPWSDHSAFEKMAAIVLQKADELEVPLVWGGNWAMRDMPHFELKEAKANDA